MFRAPANHTSTTIWDKRYLLAKRYFEDNGNLLMPSSYKVDGIDIGRWLAIQRDYYRKDDGSITAEQVDALNNIGMDWRSFDEQMWDSSYERVKRYYRLNGNLECPAPYKEEDGYKLGAWIRSQLENQRSTKSEWSGSWKAVGKRALR